MAIRTISATGGNFGSASTWEEGIVPVSADDIIGTTASGNLIMNTNYNVSNVDFLNYTGTINCSQSTGSINVQGATATFNPNMIILTRSGGGQVQFFSPTSITINPNGLTFGRIGMGQGTKTFVTPLNIDCTYYNNQNPATEISANISSTTFVGQINLWNGGVFNSSDTIVMNAGSTFSFRGYTGSTCFWDTSPFGRGLFEINTEGGTFYTKRSLTSTGQVSLPMTIKYVSGNLGNIAIASNGFTNLQISGMTVSSLQLYEGSTTTATEKIKAENAFSLLNNGTVAIYGTQGFHFNSFTIQRNNTSFLNNPSAINACSLVLENGGEYIIDKFVATGFGATLSNYQTIIRAATASGTPCNMTIGTSSSVLGFLDIRDIDATSTTYVLGETLNTLTRTTGFTTSIPTGGGGGSTETSHTFIL